MKRFSVEAVFKAIDKVTAPVNRMSGAVGRFTRRTEMRLKKYDRLLGSIASGFKKVAVAGAVAGAVVGGAMADVIKTGAQFEQSLTNASAKFSGIEKGGEAYRKLEEAARRSGRMTEFTASQSADALNELAKAGFTAQQAIAALPNVVNLATASETDLAQATDIAVGSLGAFNLKVDDAIQLGKNLSRVNNVLAATTTSSKTTMETLNETFKQAGPPAHAAGASIETLAALAGKLGDANIDASLAGTTLKNMFLKLASPGAGAAKILKRLGVSTQDSNGNLRDIIDILGDLEKGLDGVGTAKRSAILKEVFDLRAISGANVLLGIGADKLKEYRKEITDTTAADTMAALMRSTLANRWKEFNSAVESVKISTFKKAEGSINKIVLGMTKWVRQNEKLIASRIGQYLDWIFANPGKIFKWVKAIAAIVAVVGTLIITVKSLIAVITLLNLIMTLSPVGWLIIGIVALGVAIAAIVVYFEEWTNWVRQSSTAFKLLAVAVGIAFGPVSAGIILIALLVSYFDELQEVFTNVFTDMFIWWDNLVKKATDTIDAIRDATEKFALDAEYAVTFDATKLAAIEKRMEEIGDREVAREIRANKMREVENRRSIVTPAQSVTRQMSESTTTNTTEVTIKDETGRAALTGPSVPGLNLMNSGAFGK